VVLACPCAPCPETCSWSESGSGCHVEDASGARRQGCGTACGAPASWTYNPRRQLLGEQIPYTWPKIVTRGTNACTRMVQDCDGILGAAVEADVSLATCG
jgi:hypothetical protein